ncbi:SprT family zinc-dependent metalloprotease [Aestuariicoccus sp. MJ-SS9]|uniref:M48 family metallopeptidase n=1 Tax=Aestuariicoccus sp. MJ-SS9 TaxID=3079855 RepID=UPI002906F9D7|nr:SprT family zinc-dependent metalloprotease [Aestuariicoccus sp. MJ-SS9]MDU8913909.1 SprT family zinc-dependent metalloprotease [Aestuariicoccus sp. MJ-SS9]
MGQFELPGNPPITVILRRSARARRISLRLSQLDGRVTLTLPKRVPEAEGRAFVLEKEAWLRRHLDNQEAPVRIAPGAHLPIEGVPHVVTPVTGARVVLSDGAIGLPGGRPRAALGWLRTRARDRLVAASDRYAAELGRGYTRITLRDTRSRWGSCSHDGALMYSWRLILAPPEVLDYVAAHEVAHLAEMNHSSAFWAHVERLYGDWKPMRRWLREHGAGLHRYRFDD